MLYSPHKTKFYNMRLIKEIIVHCSATPEGKDFRMSDIDRWHKAQGWSGCGYHYVIDLDGKIEFGRSISKQGAHASGHNANSIGVCYIGGCAADGRTPKDTRTERQKESLEWVLLVLKATFPMAKVIGHNEISKKACPSFRLCDDYKLRKIIGRSM